MFINWKRAKGIRIRYYKVVGMLVKLFSSHPRPAEKCNKPAAVRERELKELAQNCADVGQNHLALQFANMKTFKHENILMSICIDLI